MVDCLTKEWYRSCPNNTLHLLVRYFDLSCFRKVFGLFNDLSIVMLALWTSKTHGALWRGSQQRTTYLIIFCECILNTMADIGFSDCQQRCTSAALNFIDGLDKRVKRLSQVPEVIANSLYPGNCCLHSGQKLVNLGLQCCHCSWACLDICQFFTLVSQFFEGVLELLNLLEDVPTTSRAT